MNSFYNKAAYEITIAILKVVLFLSQLGIRSIYSFLKFLYFQVVKFVQILIKKYSDICISQKKVDAIAEYHIDKTYKQLQNQIKNSN